MSDGFPVRFWIKLKDYYCWLITKTRDNISVLTYNCNNCAIHWILYPNIKNKYLLRVDGICVPNKQGCILCKMIIPLPLHPIPQTCCVINSYKVFVSNLLHLLTPLKLYRIHNLLRISCVIQYCLRYYLAFLLK